MDSISNISSLGRKTSMRGNVHIGGRGVLFSYRVSRESFTTLVVSFKQRP